MYFPDVKMILTMNRDQRNLDQDWTDLRTWVQEHHSVLRLTGIAMKAGINPELVSALLLRDPSKTRAGRGFERLDALLEVVMMEPFCYRPRWVLP